MSTSPSREENTCLPGMLRVTLNTQAAIPSFFCGSPVLPISCCPLAQWACSGTGTAGQKQELGVAWSMFVGEGGP